MAIILVEACIGMSIDSKPSDEIRSPSPSWDDLYRLAAGQSGWFTGQQAHGCGFSDQLLAKHTKGGLLERRHRGIYRLARFPPADQEDLVVAWLWSRQEGVVSHETALQLHHLSDALPARIHLTLPTHASGEARKVPHDLSLHFADIPEADRTWMGPVPVTRPARTVRDVARDHGDAQLIEAAINQGIRDRVFGVADIGEAATYALSFGPPWADRVFPDEATDSGMLHWFRGRSSRPLPSDWPTLVDDVVCRHGGELFYRRPVPSDNEVLVVVAWPTQPPDSVLATVQRELAEALSWS